MHIELVTREGRVILRASVELEQGLWSGEVEWLDEAEAPRFREFESLVNDQVLSLVDDCMAEIDAQAYRVRFQDGRLAQVTDLQVYPLGLTLSFRGP